MGYGFFYVHSYNQKSMNFHFPDSNHKISFDLQKYPFWSKNVFYILIRYLTLYHGYVILTAALKWK